jgi:hypothetical protein
MAEHLSGYTGLGDRAKSQSRLADEFSGLLSAIGATDAVRALAEATASVFRDSRQLEAVIEQYANTNPCQLQGRALEFLEVLKFNRAAAEAGSSLQAVATHFSDPAAAADVLIRDGQDVVKQVQAKSYGQAAAAVRTLAHPKYEGMDRLIPKDQVDHAQAVIGRHQSRFGDVSPNSASYREVGEKLTGELRAGDIHRGGTTREQAEFAAQHPQQAALQLKGMAALKEVGQAGIAGAAIGGGLQGVFTALHQSVLVGRNETTASKAVVITLQATASGAVRGGSVAAGSRVIAITARELGVGRVLGDMGPVAMANAVFEAGLSTHRFLQGSISHEQYRDELGGAALRATTATYCGMAGQLLIPVPIVGAAVGAITGYVAAAVLVESGVLGIGTNNIVAVAEKRRQQVERECAEAILQLRRCQQELEALEANYRQGFRETFQPLLEQIRAHQQAGRFNDTFVRLVYMGDALGYSLPWRSLAEFDDFMIDDSRELTL